MKYFLIEILLENESYTIKFIFLNLVFFMIQI